MFKRTFVFLFLLTVCFEVATAAGRLEIISPKSDERAKAGDRVLIKWTRGKAGRWVSLEALTNDKSIIIKKKLRNRGVFRWAIPKDLPPGGYIIKVSSLKHQSSAMSGIFIIDNPNKSGEKLALPVAGPSCKGVPPVVYADERSLQLRETREGSMYLGLWAGAVALHGKAVIDFGFDFDLNGMIEPVIGELADFKRSDKFSYHKEKLPSEKELPKVAYGCQDWLPSNQPDPSKVFTFRMNVIAVDSDNCLTIEPIEVYVSEALCTKPYDPPWSYPEILSTEPPSTTGPISFFSG